MPNTSATGGYLTPSLGPNPAYDVLLDIQMQRVVSGITGIAGNLVRPRWQPDPPDQPARTVDWCAVGITGFSQDYGTYNRHISAGDGRDETETYETLELLTTFYGPASSGMAAIFRDGLWVPQNREALRTDGMALLDVGRVTVLGELVNQEYIRRADLPVTLRRVVSRTYPILNLLQAQIALETKGYTQNFTVSEN